METKLGAWKRYQGTTYKLKPDHGRMEIA